MKIRNLFKHVALLALPAVVLLGACDEPDQDKVWVEVDGQVTYKITQTENVDSPQQIDLNVYSTSGLWSATSSDESWCTVLKDSTHKGESETGLDLLANETGGYRQATVTFYSGSAKHILVVEQAAGSAYITLTSAAMTVNQNAHTGVRYEFTVSNSTNVANLNATTSVGWVKPSIVTVGSGDAAKYYVEMAIEANNEMDARVADIKIVDGNIESAPFKLTQLGSGDPYIEVTEGTSFTYGDTAADKTLNFTTNISLVAGVADWSVSSSDESWIQNAAIDVATQKITFSITANVAAAPREGKITITANVTGGKITTRDIMIKQNGLGMPFINILEQFKVITVQRAFEAEKNPDGTYVTDSKGNLNYLAVAYAGFESNATPSEPQCSADWLELEVVTVNGVSSISVATTQSNPNKEDREAVVTVSAEKGNEFAYDSFKVIQKGIGNPFVEVTPESKIVPKTGLADFVVSTITDTTGGDIVYSWTVTGDSSAAQWCKVDGAANGAQAKFDFAENETGRERTCTITVSMTVGSEVATAEIVITQLAE